MKLMQRINATSSESQFFNWGFYIAKERGTPIKTIGYISMLGSARDLINKWASRI